MNIKLYPATVRLDQSQWDAIRSMARSADTTPADVIRSAVADYISGAKRTQASDRRQIRTGEFSHLVLDFIMRRQFPDSRDRLIAELERCMELYHGA